MLEKQRPRNRSFRNPAKTNLTNSKIEPDPRSSVAKQNALDNHLITAASDGRIGESRGLLGKGANVNVIDEGGNTPLMFACRYGHKDIVALLLDNNANVNLTDNYGWSALMWAAMNNRIKIMALLMERGAFVGMGDKTRVLMWNTSGHGKTDELISQMKKFQDLFSEGDFRPFLSDFRQCAGQ